MKPRDPTRKTRNYMPTLKNNSQATLTHARLLIPAAITGANTHRLQKLLRHPCPQPQKFVSCECDYVAWQSVPPLAAETKNTSSRDMVIGASTILESTREVEVHPTPKTLVLRASTFPNVCIT